MRGILGGLAALTVLVGAAPTQADVTCAVAANTLTVTHSNGTDARVSALPITGQIVVVKLNPDMGVPCTNGPTNTSAIDTINVNDATAGGFSTIEINNPAAFGPGVMSEAPNSSEVEWNISLGDGSDGVRLVGTAAEDRYRAGAAGINANLAGETGVLDADIFVTDVESVTFSSGLGNDELSGQGGAGTGNPYTGAVSLFGEDGDDILDGNDALNIMNAGPGSDQIIARDGDDFFAAGTGDDIVSGGPGIDTFIYSDAQQGTLDLEVTEPQDTGEGVDTISGVDNVTATEGNDVIRGTDGSNEINGGGGDDLIEGRGGDDFMSFSEEGEGNDTVSYESDAAGVNVSLAVDGPQDTGGSGTDVIVPSADNVIGSAFADNLTGTDGPNLIRGGGGADTISALDGDDRVELRDGTRDSADCGDGTDTALADPEGTDTLMACETVDFAPFPPSDTVAPVFAGAVRAQPKRFRVAPRVPSDFSDPARVAKGTTFVYTLSESAAVTFAFDRRVSGRRVGGRCRKTTRRNRGRRRCPRFVRVGARLTDAGSGENRTRFNGVVRRRRLRAGRYRGLLTAVDEAGNRSSPAAVSFTIVKPNKKKKRNV